MTCLIRNYATVLFMSGGKSVRLGTISSLSIGFVVSPLSDVFGKTGQIRARRVLKIMLTCVRISLFFVFYFVKFINWLETNLMKHFICLHILQLVSEIIFLMFDEIDSHLCCKQNLTYIHVFVDTMDRLHKHKHPQTFLLVYSS